MRKALTALLAAALIAGLAPAALASGDGDSTYLALGDSVAAGTQQPDLFTDNGYTNRLFQTLDRWFGFDEFVNLACPGDDTAEMLDGDASDTSVCYGTAPPIPFGAQSQLDAAVAYLAANPGEVELITIAIGANDLLACDPASLPEVLQACVAAQLGQIGANLPVIVGTLQATAPGVPIVAMNYYNPNLAFWITGPDGQALAAATNELTAVFNDTLGEIYGALGVPVVDVEGAFLTFVDRGNPPINVRAICRLTLMCERTGFETFELSDYDPNTPGPQTDIHPSNAGYWVIAAAHLRTLYRAGII